MGSPGKFAVTKTLAGVSLLLVEDDFLLLLELEAVLRDAGAEPVYSCRTVAQALTFLDGAAITAAILDVRVGRDSVAPVAIKLAQRGTPFLFYTGQTAEDRITAQWPDCPVLSKPASRGAIVKTLAGLLNPRPAVPRHAASP